MTLARRQLMHLAAFSLLSPTLSVAQGGIDPQGKYELIEPPQPTETSDKVEVLDVFWYGCPHCYNFLPVMEAYEANKPRYVEIRRMPAIFRQDWEIHARAYYTASLLNMVDRIHRPLFDAIHARRQNLNTRQSLREFFVSNGTDGDSFDKTFDSFAVDALLRKSTVMQGRYGVRGTPTVIVNGRYRIMSNSAGGHDNVVKVAHALAVRDYQAMLESRQG